MAALDSSCKGLVFVDASAVPARSRFECLPLEPEVAQPLQHPSHPASHTGGYHSLDTGNREERALDCRLHDCGLEIFSSK